ncbi:glycosyltransferase family 39 protein, partial [Oligoflexia bacterium]|nr:glycosyltransferase family 39 protein [Oligoflexia bacterium]
MPSIPTSSKQVSSKQGAHFATIFIIACQALFFIPIAFQRLIARDEGFYVLASKLVMEGKMLYAGFFYPQMPLLPYVYGSWMEVLGYSWIAARLLSASFSIILGTLLFKYCQKCFGMVFGLVAVVLFCSSSLVYPWYTTVQTYSLSSLLLFVAFFFATSISPVRRKTTLLLAGVAFGLAVDTRLFFIGVFPFFPLYFLTTAQARGSAWRDNLCFLLGMILACTPNIYFMLANFDNYFFNNLGYHLVRSGQSAEAELQHKFKVLRVLLAIDESRKFHGFQFALLFYLSVAYAVLCSIKRRKVAPAVFIAALLCALNFLPNPAYVQYFCTTIPFLVVAVMAFASQVWEALPPPEDGPRKLAGLKKRANYIVCASLLFTGYIWSTPLDIHKYTLSGQGVIGIGKEENAADWRVSRIAEVTKKLDQHAKPGEEVLTWWPGYLLGSHATSFKKLENHFGLLAASRLDEAQRERFKVMTKKQRLQLIKEGKAQVLLLGNHLIKKRMKSAL